MLKTEMRNDKTTNLHHMTTNEMLEVFSQENFNAARAVEKAGAFALVLECVPYKLAEKITSELSIPTIGIGAGKGCNGQVLVYQDMLGMYSDFTPKFVKKYANLGEIMKSAFKNYIDDLDNGAFPQKENTYEIEDEVITRLY